jgi:hypothetical protein
MDGADEVRDSHPLDGWLARHEPGAYRGPAHVVLPHDRLAFRLTAAAATPAVLPVRIAGWTAQKWLVRGLSPGAVK